jgi:hypothetical protein
VGGSALEWVLSADGEEIRRQSTYIGGKLMGSLEFGERRPYSFIFLFVKSPPPQNYIRF